MRRSLPSGTPVELAAPQGRPAHGLVVAPDIGGLRPLFDDLCASLSAGNGWAVAAVEPFPGREDLDVTTRLGIVGELDDARQVGDLTAAATLLRDDLGVERVSVLGFCMGGMYAMKASGTGAFDRAVAFYGMIRVPEQWQSPTQGDPLEQVRRGACPLLGIFGSDDPWTPPGDIEALRGAGAHVTVEVYDGADHGFVHDPSRPAHRPDDAADAWRRAAAFLS